MKEIAVIGKVGKKVMKTLQEYNKKTAYKLCQNTDLVLT